MGMRWRQARQVRVRLGLVQKEFAALVGLSQGQLSKVERSNKELSADLERRVLAVLASRGMAPEPPPEAKPPLARFGQWLVALEGRTLALASLGTVLLLALAWGLPRLWRDAAPRPEREGCPCESGGACVSYLKREAADGGLLEEPAEPLAARPFPDHPLKGQKLPPCDVPEDEVRGGCWLGVDNRPCPPRAYQLEDRCLVPVKAEPPKPSSNSPVK